MKEQEVLRERIKTELQTMIHVSMRNMARGNHIDAVINVNPYLDEIERLISEHTAVVEREKKQLLESLYWMYSQYCSGGHDFMNAGEDASEMLENYGYIQTDGAGRIVKDNYEALNSKEKEQL